MTGKPATFPPAAHTHPGSEITSQVASAQAADAVPWSGVTGKPATFPPSAHTHAGSDITSPVANASSADAVPWTGVTGKPATFPPSTHTHPGSDITSPVANASSADAVPWTGVTGKPATFPPSAHTHNGADIIDNTLAGSKLQDGAVTFAKLRTDQNAFTDLSTTALAINGGAAFSAGLYAFRLSIPNGSIAPFMLSVAFRNGGYEFSVNNLNGASVAVSGVFGATYFDFTNMFDGRTYRLSFNTTNDSAHGSGATERTALISLIENQLNMILRSEGRRQKHVKKIQRVCGPSQYQPFTNDEHIEHERRFELGIDVRSALSHLTEQEQAVCAALSDEMPRCGIAKKLNISRYEVERIIEGLAEKFSEKNLDAWVRE